MVAPSKTPEGRRAYYQAHREDWRVYNRAYYQTHRGERLVYNQVHQEEQRTYQQAYSQIHREEQLVYQRVYGQTHREERKMKRAEIQQRLNELKLCAGCCFCGYATNPVALAFHHARGDKEIAIANAVKRGWGWERIKVELEKCDVSCHNCHAIASWSTK